MKVNVLLLDEPSAISRPCLRLIRQIFRGFPGAHFGGFPRPTLPGQVCDRRLALQPAGI